MPRPMDLAALLRSFDDFEEELKPVDAWSTLIGTLDGFPIADELPALEGGPFHQWLEEVANAVDLPDLVATLDRELHRRVGLEAATSQPAERLLISLCQSLERVAWAKGGTARRHRA